jgi:hypothetical protein
MSLKQMLYGLNQIVTGVLELMKMNLVEMQEDKPNKLLKRKNNSWPSLRDYSQPFFSA